MAHTSSSYVSPNLAPTAAWGEQTSAGVFRPPPSPSFSLPPPATAVSDLAQHSELRLPPAMTKRPSRHSTPHHGPRSPPVGPAGPVTPAGAPDFGEPTRLARLIAQSVHAEIDVFNAQRESNRVLETALARERRQHHETRMALDAITEALEQLRRIHAQQEQLLAVYRARS